MVTIDENQEAIARICMYVDTYDQSTLLSQQELCETDGDALPEPSIIHHHWAIGSARRKVNAVELQQENEEMPEFCHFVRDLARFLDENLVPDICPSQPYNVRLPS
ncbi:MAG TPA: hypothetical protein VGO47_09825, partial [Chlamydiales bacterium]|nr:hypothetical protein [Chlamydiales bacterium]